MMMMKMSTGSDMGSAPGP